MPEKEVAVKKRKEPVTQANSYLMVKQDDSTGVVSSLYKFTNYNDFSKPTTDPDPDTQGFAISLVQLPDPIINKRIQLPAGSITFPALSWAATGEENSGRYRIGVDNYGEAVDGVLIYDWNGSRVLFAKQIQHIDGTAAAPAIVPSSDTDSGRYRLGIDNLGEAVAGAAAYDWNATRIFSSTLKIRLGADADVTTNDYISIDKTVNGNARVTLINRSGLGLASSGFYALNENILGVEFGLTGSSWTPFGNFNANEAFIACDSGVPLLINVPTGQGMRIATGNTVRWTLSSTGMLTWTGTASTSGSPVMLSLTAPAHTALAADTEASDVRLNLARTVQFTAGAGAFTNQRAVRIDAPTYSATAAETITNAASLYVSGAPVAGTNMTLTNAYALWIDAGKVQLDDELIIGGALNHDGTTVGFYGVTPVVRSAAYTPTNVTTDRAYDANATTLDEIADVLGTLLQDLTLTGIIG